MSDPFSEEITPPSWMDDDDAGIWEEVYVEQNFNFDWPPLIDPEGNPLLETVIDVTAAAYSGVTYDLIGVRGAYSYEQLFKPEIKFVAINRHGQGSYNYLYQFNPDSHPFKLVPYVCTYSNLATQTNTIRVWQDYTIGRNWIVKQIAKEEAYDASFSNR